LNSLDIPHPGWLEISIEIHPVAFEALSAFLFDMGCTGLVSENSRQLELKAYLPLEQDDGEIRRRIEDFLGELERIFPEAGQAALKLTRMKDENWSDNWRKFFHPQQITPNLMVLPPWEVVPAFGKGHMMRIDPGLAFGTGQHATTQMCLKAMEKVLLVRPWTMLDVGTGSGILAIYAAMLGAEKVLALDIDPEAVRCAEKNIQMNATSGRIELSLKPLEELHEAFTLLVANLLPGEIFRLLPQFTRLILPKGWLILSGFMKGHTEAVKKLLDSHGFMDRETLFQQDWACMICKNGDGGVG